MAQVVDDFSDGDIDEYTGATDQYTVNNSVLEATGTGVNYRIISTSGLANYPGAGDVYAAEMGAFGGDGNPEMLFATEDTDNWFSLALAVAGDRIVYQKADGDGDQPSELNETSVSLSTDRWYDVRISFSASTTSNYVFNEGTEISVGEARDTDILYHSGTPVPDDADASGYVREEGNPLAEIQSFDLSASVYDSPESTDPIATVNANDETLSEGGIGWRNAFAVTANERFRNARIL